MANNDWLYILDEAIITMDNQSIEFKNINLQNHLPKVSAVDVSQNQASFDKLFLFCRLTKINDKTYLVFHEMFKKRITDESFSSRKKD